MKTTSQIVAGGGWRGTRLDRVKVKACISLKAKGWVGGNASKALTKGHDYSLPKVLSSLLAMGG